MRILILTLLTTISISLSGQRNKVSQQAIIHDTIVIEHRDTVLKITKDTVVIYSIPKEMQDRYNDILAKTNEQLNLSWTPYGIAIASLGVVIAILTIVAAVVFWLQSSDFKKTIKDTVNKYEGILESFLNQKKEQVAKIETKIDERINEYENKLKEAGEEQKKEIEKTIIDLKNRKKLIEEELENTTVVPFTINDRISSIVSGSKKLHRCSSCRYGYFIQDPLDPLYGISGTTSSYIMPRTTIGIGLGLGIGDRYTECPKCHNVETL